MMIKENFTKHCTGGQPTKYEQEKHIGLLFDTFNKGEGVMAFCADAAISRSTFFLWLQKHKELKEAYDIAINIAGRQWEAYPLKNSNFNFPYWSMIMRNRFGYGRSRFKLSDKKKASEMMQAAKEHLDEDNITINDYTAIVNSAKMQAIIDGECIEEEKIYHPSSREELLEKKALLENIVETQAKITQMQRTNENPKISKGKIIS